MSMCFERPAAVHHVQHVKRLQLNNGMKAWLTGWIGSADAPLYFVVEIDGRERWIEHSDLMTPIKREYLA